VREDSEVVIKFTQIYPNLTISHLEYEKVTAKRQIQQGDEPTLVLEAMEAQEDNRSINRS
jgi:hypothetical protein